MEPPKAAIIVIYIDRAVAIGLKPFWPLFWSPAAVGPEMQLAGRSLTIKPMVD